LVYEALLEGSLPLSPNTKPNYLLEDLLVKCDSKAKMPKEDKQWLKLNSIGNEIL
jgi:hypothetical protein